MPKLFITPREITLINDWVKEFMKDVVGQKIAYYPVSVLKTKIHPVYDEAVTKIFENPISIPVIASQPNWETRHNKFGMEQSVTVEMYIQSRDLIDKNLVLAEGDFFTYGDAVFEVVSYLNFNNIFGQEDYQNGYKLIGKLARTGQFDPNQLFSPIKDENKPYAETSVQHEFEQQRGLPENSEGATADFRQVRDRLKDEMAPIALGEGPAKIDMSKEEDKQKASSFVNDTIPAKKFMYDE